MKNLKYALHFGGLIIFCAVWTLVTKGGTSSINRLTIVLFTMEALGEYIGRSHKILAIDIPERDQKLFYAGVLSIGLLQIMASAIRNITNQ